MATFARRNARLPLTAVLVAGLVGTMGVDVGLAATHGAGVTGSHAAASSDRLAAERAYLAKLRPVSTRVHDAVAPIEKVGAGLVTPRTGAGFAARDAFVHGEARSGLRAALSRLARLHPPTEFRADHAELRAALRKMGRAVRRVATLTGDFHGIHLLDVINNTEDTVLAPAVGQWDATVDRMFHRAHRKAPRGLARPGKLAASRTSWIFAADVACSASSFRLAGLLKLHQQHTVSSFERSDRMWIRALTLLHKRLTSLPRPHGRWALPTALRARLRVLTFNAKVLRRHEAALRRVDVSALTKADDQIREVTSSLRQLAKEFRSYGAGSCGAVVGTWGGKAVVTHRHHAGSVRT